MDHGGPYGTSGMGRQENPPPRGRADTGFRQAITVQYVRRAPPNGRDAALKTSARKRGELPRRCPAVDAAENGDRGAGGQGQIRAEFAHAPPAAFAWPSGRGRSPSAAETGPGALPAVDALVARESRPRRRPGRRSGFPQPPLAGRIFGLLPVCRVGEQSSLLDHL
jgi:hypothetical protein